MGDRERAAIGRLVNWEKAPGMNGPAGSDANWQAPSAMRRAIPAAGAGGPRLLGESGLARAVGIC
jgi:hypothetical protein